MIAHNFSFSLAVGSGIVDEEKMTKDMQYLFEHGILNESLTYIIVNKIELLLVYISLLKKLVK